MCYGVACQDLRLSDVNIKNATLDSLLPSDNVSQLNIGNGMASTSITATSGQVIRYVSP